MHFGKGARRPGLPEIDSGCRGWTVHVASAIPIQDEVVPKTSTGMHPQDELHEPVPPILQRRVAGGGLQAVQQCAGTGGAVDTGNTLPSALASLGLLAPRIGVNGQG